MRCFCVTGKEEVPRGKRRPFEIQIGYPGEPNFCSELQGEEKRCHAVGNKDQCSAQPVRVSDRTGARSLRQCWGCDCPSTPPVLGAQQQGRTPAGHPSAKGVRTQLLLTNPSVARQPPLPSILPVETACLLQKPPDFFIFHLPPFHLRFLIVIKI